MRNYGQKVFTVFWTESIALKQSIIQRRTVVAWPLRVGTSSSASLTSQAGDCCSSQNGGQGKQGGPVGGRVYTQAAADPLLCLGSRSPPGSLLISQNWSDSPVNGHISSTPTGQSGSIVLILWPQPQCKLENRNYTCLALHSTPSTGLSWGGWRDRAGAGGREVGGGGHSRGRQQDALVGTDLVINSH